MKKFLSRLLRLLSKSWGGILPIPFPHEDLVRYLLRICPPPINDELKKSLADMRQDVLYKRIPENLLGRDALWKLLKEYEFYSVLDLGAGTGGHSRVFHDNGKLITAIVAYDFHQFDEDLKGKVTLIQDDYSNHQFEQKFDLIWASHMLEHVRNIGLLLDKINSDLKDEGILALSVPFMEPVAGGGHCNFFGPGQAIYHLLESGFDLSDMRLKVDGYNMSIICRKNEKFKPHDANFALLLANYKERLPDYVWREVERLIEKKKKTGDPYYERIPLSLTYKW
ncbi:MAG: class I SAM-dependent methyltransferase [Synergistaceae bacterium]|jgi:SAM-dependent methyltransferase|nr:class I SAM-dependent methyltransferase [Synergistaceae bacterium]